MQVFNRISNEYEQVAFCHDDKVGLKAIIAIHSTVLGPSLGGTRFYPYASEEDALEDVLRLSRGMTYKSSAAGLDLGGGKAVIIGDPLKDKSVELLKSYARFVDSLSGRYITAEDVGTSLEDMDVIRQETPYATGIRLEKGGSGDPSPVTAWGVFNAARAVATRLWGTDSLDGKRVTVNGVGKVGSHLVDHLVEAGALVTISDINEHAIRKLTAKHNVATVPPESAHSFPADIYAPCALGGALNSLTIPALDCKAVCGAANNQLADPLSAAQLDARGIIYAPDYIVNAGGVINIAEELAGYDQVKAYERAASIFETTLEVFEIAETKVITTAEAADDLAENRVNKATLNTERIRRFPK